MGRKKKSTPAVDEQIEAMNEPRTDLPPDAGPQEPTDRHGRTFDPNLHVTDDKGRPVRTKKYGYLRMKGTGGRPRKQEDPPQQTATSQGSIGGLEELARGMGISMDTDAAGPKVVGAMVAQADFAAHVALFGEDYLPESQETAYMQEGWGRVMEAHGIDDINPWTFLALCHVMYHLPRSTKPRARGFMKKRWDWFKSLFKGRKHASRADRGDDRKRENDAGH